MQTVNTFFIFFSCCYIKLLINNDSIFYHFSKNHVLQLPQLQGFNSILKSAIFSNF
nr:MAG TPA: hypothetical protein [Caudoviricetes sp.]